MPSNDDMYGGTWRPMQPISSRLKVTHSTDPADKHPSAFDKTAPPLKEGMGGGMKYQKAKKVKRRKPKNAKDTPTTDGSDLSDLAADTGTPMSGEEKFAADLYLQGNEEAGEYFT